MIKTRAWNGKPVGVPGIVSGMPIETYHSTKACIEPSVSSGALRTMFTKSPKHYWAASPYNPKRFEDDDESEALTVGRAAHHLLFGIEEFRKEFAVTPENLGGEPFSLRRKVCKLWWEERQAERRTPIKREQFDHIMGMAESLQAEPLVQAGILNGDIEMSWFIKHKKTGLWLKSRPDATPNASLDIADLKTSHSVAWDSLQATIYQHGYFIQAGLTAMLAFELFGQPLNSFTFVFVEKTPPYDVAIVTLKENEIARGIRVAEAMAARFAECLASGNWPGRYAGHAEGRYIEMRDYAQKQIDDRLRYGDV